MQPLRILLSAGLMLFGVLTASTFLPVATAQAGFFNRVHARVGSSGLWEITNNSSAARFIKFRVSVRGSGIWQNHKATLPPGSTRMMGYDSKTYVLRVEEVN